MEKLTNPSLIQKLTARFADQISVPAEPYGLLTFETGKDTITEVLKFLIGHRSDLSSS